MVLTEMKMLRCPTVWSPRKGGMSFGLGRHAELQTSLGAAEADSAVYRELLVVHSEICAYCTLRQALIWRFHSDRAGSWIWQRGQNPKQGCSQTRAMVHILLAVSVPLPCELRLPSACLLNKGLLKPTGGWQGCISEAEYFLGIS